jgi:hypothetical protein
VFPTQELVVVRTGTDPGLVPAGGQDWEHGIYTRVLAALTDTKVERPADAPDVPAAARTDTDYGFQTALFEPDQYSQGAQQTPLPPAGPERARAVRIAPASPRAGRRGYVRVKIGCPPRSQRDCTGAATLDGARKPVSFTLAPGATGRLRFRLTRAARRGLPAAHELAATTTDAADGVVARAAVTIRARRIR